MYLLFISNNKKISQNFIIHNDNETLYQVVPNEILGGVIDQQLPWTDHNQVVGKF